MEGNSLEVKGFLGLPRCRPFYCANLMTATSIQLKLGGRLCEPALTDIRTVHWRFCHARKRTGCS
jgi:hypothetical protein